jgi:wyosine [tRNA(Phe)-imidazoG37] synthetase (radical SAM superfamily)
MDKEEVRIELAAADFVVAKLDAYVQDSFRQINRPENDLEFGAVLDGIKQFRKEYSGKLALQIMFIEENKNNVAQLAYLVNYTKPDEIQINTPLRSCNVKPLPKEDILRIKEYFIDKCGFRFDGSKVDVISVYDTNARKEISPISSRDMLKRRGKS